MQNKIVSLGVAVILVAGLVGANMPQNVPVAQAALVSCGAFNRFASQIVGDATVMGPGEVPDDSASVFGAPDGGSADFIGPVTIGFDHNVRITGRFIVHVEDFSTVGEDGVTPENESYIVSVSDGTRTALIGTKVPTQAAPKVRQAHEFTIAGSGITRAQSVTITALNQVGNHSGPEIDAIEIVDGTNCPETPKTQCSDGIDNDGDGKVDMDDPGCKNPEDNDEKDDKKAQCADGIDNDGDGLVDADDPGCHDDQDLTKAYNPEDDNEHNGQCSDKKDNDGDGLIDRKDPDCHTDGNVKNDNSFDGSRDENTDNRPKVAAVKVVQPAAVAITAKTGAGMLGLITGLTGLTGLTLSLRKFIK